MPPLRILLVEDHADTLVPLARLLLLHGYHVQTATTYSEALAAARQDRFDVLVSDLVLPDGCGLELLREICSRYQIRGIAVTGYAHDYRTEASLAAGYSKHLTKPILLDDLLEALPGEGSNASADGGQQPGRSS
jgi:CheY-like chemotaxis protein